MSLTTLQDFNRYSSRQTVQASLRRARISDEGPYDEFIDQLYLDIDQVINRMQAGRELRQDDGEDRLSGDILLGLDLLGYDTVADAKTGGHVDLSIKLGPFSWIGEAKKDGNFQEGFLQLSTRYVPASGNYNHNQGGLLFYLVDTKNARGTLDTWRDALTTQGHACVACPRNPLAFYSDHTLEGSGLPFKIRTMGVTLYHKPQDKSARASAKRKATKKAATG